ncbi:MAG: LysR family transcriptional regulator, partial [Xanthobacter sp. 35-67-6]
MIAWDDFRLVKAVAETRSLAGAAEMLGVNHSTVFRRLGTLEATLGTRLFERARSGYAPTPTGEEMVRLADRMAEDILAVERRITGQDLRPSGELRVTTNDTLLVHLLTPIFGSFHAAYPEIRLEVLVS